MRVAARAARGTDGAAPYFSPERFFVGATEGTGTLSIIARRPHAVRVYGNGRLEPDGTLVLTQLVDEAGKPRTQRQWRIRRVAPGRYAGALSDVAGLIAGTVDGNLLRLRFRMTGGLTAEQHLYLQPGGRTALNRMTVRKLGVVVAVLSETIRQVGGSKAPR